MPNLRSTLAVVGNRDVLALGHPVAVISLFGLIINDHLLKAEFGNGLTGKLSDVFGLVVIPLLLAAVLDKWVSRPMRWAAISTGLLFLLIKTIPLAAVTVASGLSFLTPSRIVADPTDLLALPAIGVGWFLWLRVDPEDQRGWKLPVGSASGRNVHRWQTSVVGRPVGAVVDREVLGTAKWLAGRRCFDHGGD